MRLLDNRMASDVAARPLATNASGSGRVAFRNADVHGRTIMAVVKQQRTMRSTLDAEEGSVA